MLQWRLRLSLMSMLGSRRLPRKIVRSGFASGSFTSLHIFIPLAATSDPFKIHFGPESPYLTESSKTAADDGYWISDSRKGVLGSLEEYSLKGSTSHNVSTTTAVCILWTSRRIIVSHPSLGATEAAYGA